MDEGSTDGVLHCISHWKGADETLPIRMQKTGYHPIVDNPSFAIAFHLPNIQCNGRFVPEVRTKLQPSQSSFFAGVQVDSASDVGSRCETEITVVPASIFDF